MKKIESQILTTLDARSFGSHSVHDVASAEACEVGSYERLVDLVAKIGYRNPQFSLLFRGQHADHYESNTSLLFPSLWRHGPRGRRQAMQVSERWCTRLQGLSVLTSGDKRRLRAIPERPWAIIQHYSDVTACDTPLLDVTESLRVAASFATEGYLGKTKNANTHGVVFVFGFPAVREGTTISVEDGLILLRLASVCPQKARRPHFQSGFLAGTFPTNGLGGKKHKTFALRMIGKLKISTAASFWDVECPLREQALFPRTDDLRDELQDLRDEIQQGTTEGL